MQTRITRHQEDRPPNWITIEEAERVAEVVRDAAPRDAAVIVDCVTVWLANLLWKHSTLDTNSQQEIILSAVLKLAEASRGRYVIAVSNEVGHGIVPENTIARRFRDLQGMANQLLAREARTVVLVVAGLPLFLKGEVGSPKCPTSEPT
jgi:adenosyl cobinamide kinase/adenosyl cobinamide phosphate guanylyltransferase